MVLGAHLKPIKKTEAGVLCDIYKGRTEANINSHASFNSKNNFQAEMDYNEELVANTLELNGLNEFIAPENTEVFEKFISKKLKSTF